VRLVAVCGDLPSPEAWSEQLVGADALVLVGDRRRSPRTMLPAPFLADAEGRDVPTGWLPDVRTALPGFAAAAARVLRRSREQPGPIALLAQWHPRYLRLAERMDANLRRGDAPPLELFNWTAERVTRDDLVRGLRGGLGLGVYFGHGRPSGWAAYHGFRAHHLTERRGEPLGSLLSVTCLTANRRRVGLSFSEAVTLGGAAASAVGAVAHVKHLDNMRWMLGLAEALRAGELRIGPALTRALAFRPRLRGVYRILGDPLAPLVGTEAGERLAARIWAPAPEASWT
jgi:Peptidase family C25